MSNQTTVNSRIAKASPGLIADGNMGNKIISIACEPATIPFGVVVQRGTNPETQAVLGSDADLTNILGIAVRELAREAGSVGATTVGYSATEAMAIMQEGYIYAQCVAGCTAGDNVKFVNTTGALSAGAATAGETVIVGARWMETVPALGIAKLNLNINGLTAGA